jgi:hypothetical protein
MLAHTNASLLLMKTPILEFMFAIANRSELVLLALLSEKMGQALVDPYFSPCLSL